jgi:hypothetical protein
MKGLSLAATPQFQAGEAAMVTFDDFATFDSEKDLVRFRCHYQDQLVLCAVTRAALVLDIPTPVKTRDALLKLYETRSEAIQRAVLNRLLSNPQARHGVIVIGADEMYQLKRAKHG